MTFIRNWIDRLEGLAGAISRYPLTKLFLLAIAILNAYRITHDAADYSTYVYAGIVGVLLSVLAQQIYERFFKKGAARILLIIGAILLTVAYYIAIQSSAAVAIEASSKTVVLAFALSIGFVWVPSIKNSVSFNRSFMAAFKAFFTSLLFTLVIAIGLSAIALAVDQLIVSLDSDTYLHVWNITLTLFAPVFFLSRIPLYPGESVVETRGQREKVAKATECPKLLDALISYIMIPLTGIYTIVLLVYVLLNLQKDFWTDNLLEPMLVSYAVVVILVYILASNLDNPFTSVFKNIFPKVLIPIVLFQTIASSLKIGETGVTYGRYYVLMFGLFAVIAGVIFSFLSIRKHGWIAVVLIVFAAVSVIPPVDAFTVSQASQTVLLKQTLERNAMLEDGEVVSNDDISKKDKQTITRVISYLDRLEYIRAIEWLPDDVYKGTHFEETFGFEEVYDETGKTDDMQTANLDWESAPVIDTEDYDRMVYMDINYQYPEGTGSGRTVSLKLDGKEYALKKDFSRDGKFLVLVDDDDQSLLTFDVEKAFNEILGNEDNGMLEVDDATVTKENDDFKMGIVADTVQYTDSDYTGEVYVLIKEK